MLNKDKFGPGQNFYVWRRKLGASSTAVASKEKTQLLLFSFSICQPVALPLDQEDRSPPKSGISYPQHREGVKFDFCPKIREVVKRF